MFSLLLLVIRISVVVVFGVICFRCVSLLLILVVILVVCCGLLKIWFICVILLLIEVNRLLLMFRLMVGRICDIWG